MLHDSAFACTSNVRGCFTSISSRNYKQTRDLKKRIMGRLCFTASQLQADRNSSSLVSLLDKRVFKFKVRIFKWEICYFVNFKIPFTHKNWLLKFGFAYRLAQILEPKLLVHEILKFVINSFGIKRMRRKALSHALLTCEGFGGFKKGDKGTAS